MQFCTQDFLEERELGRSRNKGEAEAEAESMFNSVNLTAIVFILSTQKI